MGFHLGTINVNVVIIIIIVVLVTRPVIGVAIESTFILDGREVRFSSICVYDVGWLSYEGYEYIVDEHTKNWIQQGCALQHSMRSKISTGSSKFVEALVYEEHLT